MTNKKQHYVPQFLLKKFACDEKKRKIWVLDKKTNNFRCNSINDSGEENLFYKLPISKIINEGSLPKDLLKELDEECLKEKGKHLEGLSSEELSSIDYCIENFFANSIEPKLADLTNKIIESTYNGNKWVIENCYFINEEDKNDYSMLLANEWVRTKQKRDEFVNMIIDAQKKLLPVAAQFHGITIGEDDFNVEYTKDQTKMIHSTSILNNSANEMYASIFSSKIWVLLENMTKEPFCCIDNTLMLKPTYKVPDYSGYGIDTYGITIYSPISPKNMLVLFDRKKFDEKYAKKDRHIIPMYDIKEIEKINMDLIQCSYKYVFFCSEKSGRKYKSIFDKNHSTEGKSCCCKR